MYSIPLNINNNNKINNNKRNKQVLFFVILVLFCFGGFCKTYSAFCQNIKPKYDAIYGPG